MKKLVLIAALLASATARSDDWRADEQVHRQLKDNDVMGQILQQTEQVLVYNGYRQTGPMQVKYVDLGADHFADFQAEVEFAKPVPMGLESGVDVIAVLVEGRFAHAPGAETKYHIRSAKTERRGTRLSN